MQIRVQPNGASSVEKLKQIRPYVTAGAFTVFAPTDVMSRLLLALPIGVLYALGMGRVASWKNCGFAGEQPPDAGIGPNRRLPARADGLCRVHSSGYKIFVESLISIAILLNVFPPWATSAAQIYIKVYQS
jgi:hypothetical protein